jgi:uncharacterized phage protein (TIGR01671 family)
MSRQIKFRVWRKDRGDFKKIPEEYVGTRCSHSRCMRTEQNEKFCSFILDSTENSILQQSTGLKDKNGKEIYEGDIVRYIANEIVLMRYPEEECEIRWKDSNVSYGWMVRHKKDMFEWTLTRRFAKESLEVVGNIFENPELLK